MYKKKCTRKTPLIYKSSRCEDVVSKGFCTAHMNCLLTTKYYPKSERHINWWTRAVNASEENGEKTWKLMKRQDRQSITDRYEKWEKWSSLGLFFSIWCSAWNLFTCLSSFPHLLMYCRINLFLFSVRCGNDAGFGLERPVDSTGSTVMLSLVICFISMHHINKSCDTPLIFCSLLLTFSASETFFLEHWQQNIAFILWCLGQSYSLFSVH